MAKSVIDFNAAEYAPFFYVLPCPTFAHKPAFCHKSHILPDCRRLHPARIKEPTTRQLPRHVPIVRNVPGQSKKKGSRVVGEHPTNPDNIPADYPLLLSL